MKENIAGILKEMADVANLQDYEKLISFFTDDCIYEDVPTAKICHGPKEFIDMAKAVHRDFPNHKWDIVSSFSDGHKIASEGIWSGTFTHSNIPDRPATGKHVSVKTVSITEIRDGKISRNADYYDLFSFLQQAGGLPIKL